MLASTSGDHRTIVPKMALIVLKYVKLYPM